MFLDMAAKYAIPVHGRKVKESSLSFVIPRDGHRAIIRCRDDAYLHPFPQLNTAGIRALHLDGHQADAALHYARACRSAGVLTSLDGGGLRENTLELLEFIDVAICAERLAEQLDVTPVALLDLLKAKGCRIGGVTQGAKGMLWYDETGTVRRQRSLAVPSEAVIDTSGAGDVFHGAYVASAITRPDVAWEEHFAFARAASAFKIQHLGNEAGLPTREAITAIRAGYAEAA
jgi:sugar/nucleoside kinase (ribokinase family)